MSAGRGASRRRAREAALQVLYALDLDRTRRGGDGFESVEEAFEAVAAHFELPDRIRMFSRELVTGVTEHRDELDARLADHASHWRIERMAIVDRNILRLGAFELLHSTTPGPVILDEAVSLAHRFGDEPSPAFVNGVLDSVAGQREGVGG